MKAVEAFDDSGKSVRLFRSLAAAERAGFGRTCIFEVLQGRRKQHSNLAWKYADAGSRLLEFIGLTCTNDGVRQVTVDAAFQAYRSWLPANESKGLTVDMVQQRLACQYGVEPRFSPFGLYVKGLYWDEERVEIVERGDTDPGE